MGSLYEGENVASVEFSLSATGPAADARGGAGRAGAGNEGAYAFWTMRTVWPPAVHMAGAVPVAANCVASAVTGPTFVPPTWATTSTTTATLTSRAIVMSPTATLTRPSWGWVAAAAGPAALAVSTAAADMAANAFFMRGMELPPFRDVDWAAGGGSCVGLPASRGTGLPTASSPPAPRSGGVASGKTMVLAVVVGH